MSQEASYGETSKAVHATGNGSSVPVNLRGPGPKPDLAARNRLKAKYAELQREYFSVYEENQRKIKELAAKEAKCQLLQAEIDLILDQIYAADYASGIKKLPKALLYDSEEEEDSREVSGLEEGGGKRRDKTVYEPKVKLKPDGTPRLRIYDVLKYPTTTKPVEMDVSPEADL